MSQTRSEIWNITLAGQHVTLRPLDTADTPALAQAAAEDRQSYLYNPQCTLSLSRR